MSLRVFVVVGIVVAAAAAVFFLYVFLLPAVVVVVHFVCSETGLVESGTRRLWCFKKRYLRERARAREKKVQKERMRSTKHHIGNGFLYRTLLTHRSIRRKIGADVRPQSNTNRRRPDDDDGQL